MVAESVAAGLAGATEAVGVAAADDEEATAVGDTPADTLGRAEAVGVAAAVVAGFADVTACGSADLVGLTDLVGEDVVAFFVAFFEGFADVEAVAALVTGAATAGRLVPALLCQANATEPPAGTLWASTPSEA